MSKENITLVRRLFDEVYTSGNTSTLDQIIAKDFKLHDSAASDSKSTGLEACKQREAMYNKAFPTKQVHIEEIVSTEDNRVLVRWTCRGKQEGPYQGHSASGKKFQISGISIYKISNGKISEVWQNWDQLSLMEQIGIMPTARLAA